MSPLRPPSPPAQFFQVTSSIFPMFCSVSSWDLDGLAIIYTCCVSELNTPPPNPVFCLSMHPATNGETGCNFFFPGSVHRVKDLFHVRTTLCSYVHSSRGIEPGASGTGPISLVALSTSISLLPGFFDFFSLHLTN